MTVDRHTVSVAVERVSVVADTLSIVQGGVGLAGLASGVETSGATGARVVAVLAVSVTVHVESSVTSTDSVVESSIGLASRALVGRTSCARGTRVAAAEAVTVAVHRETARTCTGALGAVEDGHGLAAVAVVGVGSGA